MDRRPLNIALIGTGRRALHLYIPVLQALKETQLIGICGQNFFKTQKIAQELKVKAYRSFSEVAQDSDVDATIIAVSWTENKNLYLALTQTNLPALIETPLGKNLEEAQEVFQALSKRNIYIDVAEQYHLRPVEQLKRQLIKEDYFGNVFYAFSDGAGHEYHGMSLIRSYLGFDIELKQTAALQKDVPCFPHRIHEKIFFPGERIQHALFEFTSGAVAAYHWSWLSYESPIRSRRVAGFHGIRGICSGEDCQIFEDATQKASRIFFKRKTRVVEGIEVLSEINAFLESSLIGSWYNPFNELLLDEEKIVAALFVQNLIKSFQSPQKPLYSLHNAFQDHLLLDAMMNSARNGGVWQPA